MKKIFISIFFIVLFAFTNVVYGVIAYPYPVKITNPDGSSLDVLFHGDERFSYTTTLDGYLLQKDIEGYLTYATVDNDGVVYPTKVVANEKSRRTSAELNFLSSISKIEDFKKLQKANSRSKTQSASKNIVRNFPLSDSPRSLVILVNFADKKFISPNAQQDFYNLLNQENYSDNGATGSARDYFIASSYGKFSPVFDVVGPYDLPNKVAYYGSNQGDDPNVNAGKMVVDACRIAFENGVDFSAYDTDNDGVVDNVFIYYAGYNEAEGGGYYNQNTVWPHRFVVYPEDSSDGTEESITFNEKRIYDYACTSELKGYTGSQMCGIGTFCHEFGHVLGLPDYYHTDATSKSTLDEWSIMASGSYNNEGRTPPVYSVYDRFYLGFLTPEQIDYPSNFILEPIYQGKSVLHNTEKQAYLLSASTHNLIGNNPDPREFFMLEYRKKTGWDSYLPSEGMLIWHIDFRERVWNYNTPNNYTGNNQTYSSHMRVYIEPIDGLSTTTPGEPFTSGSFTPKTWRGVDINRAITDISMNEDNIFFRFMGGIHTPSIQLLNKPNRFISENESISEYQNIIFKTYNLSKELIFKLEDEEHFEIKLVSDDTWGKEVRITPTSNNMKIEIQIRFAPKSEGVHATNIIITNEEVGSEIVSITGVTNASTSPLINASVVQTSLSLPRTQAFSTSKKVINIKTANLTGDLSVSLTSSFNFKVSNSTIKAEDASSENGFNLTIEYSPLLKGNHSTTLTISGGGIPEQVIKLTGEAYF